MSCWEPVRASSAQFFYHYGSAKHLVRLKPVVTEHRIYLPSLQELNDPREGKPRLADSPAGAVVEFLAEGFRQRNPSASDAEVDVMRDETRRLAAFNGRDWLMRAMAEELHALFATTRVYCMSRRWDNMQMWAKYADNHEGYCLEFANTPPFHLACEVVYDDNKRLDVTKRDDAHFGWYLLKRTEWSNEEEIRLVCPLALASAYPELPFVAFPPTALRRVIVGERMTRENRAHVIEWASRRVPALNVVEARFDAYRDTMRTRPL